MDHETLAILAKFTTHARDFIGVVNSDLFVRDEVYRNEIFRRVDTQGNSELVQLAFSLRNRTEAHEASKAQAQSSKKKYLFGSRG